MRGGFHALAGVRDAAAGAGRECEPAADSSFEDPDRGRESSRWREYSRPAVALPAGLGEDDGGHGGGGDGGVAPADHRIGQAGNNTEEYGQPCWLREVVVGLTDPLGPEAPCLGWQASYVQIVCPPF